MNRIGLVDKNGQAIDLSSFYNKENHAFGNPEDSEASGDGSVIALLKRLRTLLGGTIQVAFATAQSVNATVTNFPSSFNVANSPTVSVANFPDTQVVSVTSNDTPDVFKSISALSIASESTLWTPANGKKFRLLGGLLSVTGATGNIVLKDGNSGSTILTLPNSALATPFQFSIPGGITSSAANNNLRVLGTTLQVLNGTVWGREV